MQTGEIRGFREPTKRYVIRPWLPWGPETAVRGRLFDSDAAAKVVGSGGTGHGGTRRQGGGGRTAAAPDAERRCHGVQRHGRARGCTGPVPATPRRAAPGRGEPPRAGTTRSG